MSRLLNDSLSFCFELDKPVFSFHFIYFSCRLWSEILPSASLMPSCLADNQFPEEEGGIYSFGVEAHGRVGHDGPPAAPHQLRGTGSAPTRRPHCESHRTAALYRGKNMLSVFC